MKVKSICKATPSARIRKREVSLKKRQDHVLTAYAAIVAEPTHNVVLQYGSQSELGSLVSAVAFAGWFTQPPQSLSLSKRFQYPLETICHQVFEESYPF